jgi:membrane dipeptidase
MVDVSHSSAKSTLDMIALSATPVIASHSGVKGILDHPRNLTDEALDGIKRTGGVVQVVAFDGYLKAVPPAKTEAIAALRKEMGVKPGEFDKMSPEALRTYDAKLAEIDKKWPKATVKDLGDHIDYAVKRMGVDHVGISSDFNGGGGIDGFNSSGEAINVTMELMRRGYTDEQIGKIWGGNLLRVMEKAEQYAAGLNKGAK